MIDRCVFVGLATVADPGGGEISGVPRNPLNISETTLEMLHAHDTWQFSLLQQAGEPPMQTSGSATVQRRNADGTVGSTQCMRKCTALASVPVGMWLQSTPASSRPVSANYHVSVFWPESGWVGDLQRVDCVTPSLWKIKNVSANIVDYI